MKKQMLLISLNTCGRIEDCNYARTITETKGKGLEAFFRPSVNNVLLDESQKVRYKCSNEVVLKFSQGFSTILSNIICKTTTLCL
jgi:hypothetical protein